MNILTLGTSILAVDPVDTGDQWETADQIIPKHVAAGAVVVDAVLPADYAPGRYSYDAGVFVVLPIDAAVLAAAVAAFLRQVDADTDSIYAACIGNRQSEYDQAEADALAYRAAGDTGTVPASVQSWATAKGWTATQATTDILATATLWRSAQASIRAARLLRKEGARNAEDTADAAAFDVAKAAWGSSVTAIRTSLGLPAA